MNQHVPPPVTTSLAVELVTCDGQKVMVPLYRLAEAHARLAAPKRRDEIDVIQTIVTDYFKLFPRDLCSDRRESEIVYARHVAMYLSRRLTSVSSVRIARRFGDRDHSSVYHAMRKIERLIESDPAVRRDIEILSDAIAKVKP